MPNPYIVFQAFVGPNFLPNTLESKNVLGKWNQWTIYI